jgi:S1-C subfamily serine protease
MLALVSACARVEADGNPLVSRATFPQASETPPALSGEQVVERVAPSVVLILVGERAGQLSGVGSGLITRPDGVLLTAYHLIKDARVVQVRLKNGETYDNVELLAFDERRDAAALRIPARELHALPVAKAEEAKPGETVYVVSNPGALSWTASSGVLSAIRQADEVPGAGSGYRLLQFTAPVSPGSSGGALVDAQGRALGMVIASRQGQNLNFAVPIESVVGLADKAGLSVLGAGQGLHLPQGERPPAPSVPAGVGKRDPIEIMRSVRTVYIGGTDLFPAEPIEKKLFECPEFKEGSLVIVQDASGADLVVELSRKAWTWDFTFRIVHPATGVILGSGKVIAWDGVRAAPGIANQIIKRLRELRPAPASETKKK